MHFHSVSTGEPVGYAPATCSTRITSGDGSVIDEAMFISLTTVRASEGGSAEDNLLLRLGEIKAISRSKADDSMVQIYPHIGEVVEVVADFDSIRQRLMDAGKVLP
jgi:hypothetical protein